MDRVTDFESHLTAARNLLEAEGRVSYRGLARRLGISHDDVAAIRDELIFAKRLAKDEDETVLVWTGPASEAERRHLTVMFCDLVGSTRLSARLDPDDYREIIREFQAVTNRVVEHYGGHVAQYLGDGILVYFGYPEAHEDDAYRAVAAARDIHRKLGELKTPAGRIMGRIAVHSGPVVIGELGTAGQEEQLAVGSTPNVAARLEKLAEPGGICISEATARLLGERYALEDMGRRHLAGLTESMHVYRVGDETGVQSRFDMAATAELTPLVDRTVELEHLRQLWQDAETGQGRAALIEGEPGIGKSRLVTEFRDEIAERGNHWWIMRGSPFYQNTPFHALIDLWRQGLGLADIETETGKLAALEEFLSGVSYDQDIELPMLAGLLMIKTPVRSDPTAGWSEEKRRKKLVRLMVDLMAQAVVTETRLMVFEDLQWMDPSTLQMIRLFLRRIESLHVLVVLTSRGGAAINDRIAESAERMDLGRLPVPDVGRLITATVGGYALPEALHDVLVERADGVPAFAEELARGVVHSELVRLENDDFVLTGPIADLGIPATLADALASRVDQLGPLKTLVQICAVLGRTFSHAVLTAVTERPPDSLRADIAQLMSAGLVEIDNERHRRGYRFRHALIQESAYASLVRDRRQSLHQLVVRTLEQEFPETSPELLAYHYTQAGDARAAIAHWRWAGELARERFANAEAAASWRRALELLATLPEDDYVIQQRLELLTALGPAQTVLDGWGSPAASAIYNEADALARRAKTVPQLDRILTGLFAYYLIRAEFDKADSQVARLTKLAEDGLNPGTHLSEHLAIGGVAFFRGELGEAERQLDQALAHYEPELFRESALLYGQSPGVACASWLANVRWLLGKPDAALEAGKHAVKLGEQVNHPFSIAFALVFLARVHLFRGEFDEAANVNQRASRIADEQSSQPMRASSGIIAAYLDARNEPGGHGLEALGAGIAAWEASGARLALPYFKSLLADALRRDGRLEDALTLLADVRLLIGSHGERWWAPEVERLAGVCLRDLSRRDAARAAFERAVVLAGEIGAVALTARAQASLNAFSAVR